MAHSFSDIVKMAQLAWVKYRSLSGDFCQFFSSEISHCIHTLIAHIQKTNSIHFNELLVFKHRALHLLSNLSNYHTKRLCSSKMCRTFSPNNNNVKKWVFYVWRSQFFFFFGVFSPLVTHCHCLMFDKEVLATWKQKRNSKGLLRAQRSIIQIGFLYKSLAASGITTTQTESSRRKRWKLCAIYFAFCVLSFYYNTWKLEQQET